MHRSQSSRLAYAPLLVALLAVAAVSAVALAALVPVRGAEAQAPPDLNDFQKVVLAQGTEIGEVSELTVAPDGRVFFMNRQGDMQVYDPDTRTTEIMINNPTLGVWSGLEDGGLGITVDPNFEQNNWVYVYYSPLPADANKQRLSRFTVGPDNKVDKSSERVLLEIPTQRNVCCHSAGSLQFGPDGLLYLSTGDNTSSSDNGGYSPHDERPGRSDYDAQKSSGNTNDLRGKIVRIDPKADASGEIDIVPGDDASYDIPEGNLFGEGGRYPTAKYPTADAARTKPEIYVMGLRNPYRLGVDQDTGTLYWGEVGPDSRSNDPGRGPRHFEEFNRTTEPMNGGWPYCGGFVGEDNTNQDFGGAYVDWDFTNFPGQGRRNPDGSLKRFPCSDPNGMANTNDSPNSTGLQDLPPMTDPLIPYSDVGPYKYPEVQGATPSGSQVYRQSQNTDPKDTSFPAYYEGSYFISELSRGWIKEVRLDDQGNIQSINPFMEGLFGPIDMEFGPDGSMYVLEYGSSFFSGSPDTKLVRIDYVANGRAPEANASAEPTEGASPLTVNFSSAGTQDPDGDAITYEWAFGDGTTSTEANPTHTYDEPGDYQATLTATDPGGKSSSDAVTVNVGNTRPKVDLELPLDGGIYKTGDKIRYKVTVTDAEDPTIDCSKVTVQEGFGHDSHVHPGLSVNGCEGVFETEASADHGPEANTYGVIAASYSDGGANGEANTPLTGRDIAILQPKLRQAEHATGRQGVGFTGYDDKSGTKPGGGALATGMGNSDWIMFRPMSLSRIDSVDLTYSGNPGGGAKVELRAGSPTGPVAASVPLNGPTQGQYFYKTVTGQITSRDADAGGQPLYFVYSGPGSMNFDEMRFQGSGVAVDVPPRITSATATPNDGAAPLEVDFAAAADDPDGDAITYSWDFGVEGATDDTSTQQNPTYTYQQPGPYTAMVTATDATGKSSQKTVQVIARRPCATAPAAEEGYTLLFNGRDLTGWKQSGPGGFTVEDCEMTSFGGLGMLWYSEKQFDDYSLKLQFKLSRENDNSGVFHRFPDPGNDPFVAVNQGHEVQIYEGATGEPQKTASIYNFDREDARNGKPVGEWNDYEIQVEGQTYTMFLNGQKVNEYTSDGSRGAQGFIGLQNHGASDKVSLRAVQIKELEVEEPFVNTLSGDKVRGPAPLEVNYTADAVDRQNDAITYEWDFGVPGTDADKATGKDVSYTYGDEGTYTATVTPVDARGNRGVTREARPVTAEEDPVVTASADPACGASPLEVKFTGSANDPQNQAVTYEWDFGIAGTGTDTSTEQSPTFTYEQVGTYAATLTATDPDGNTGSQTVPIRVRDDGNCLAAANLATFFNNDAISTDANPGDGAFDNEGINFAEELLPAEVRPDGGPVTLNGVTYQFPSPADGKLNSVEARGQTIPLPSGNYGQLRVLASSHNGDVQERATITYSDDSTSQVDLKFTDWAMSPKFGERIEIDMPYRQNASGDVPPRVLIFSQGVPLDETKSIKSITLPNATKLHIFAITATGDDVEEPPPPPPSRGCDLSDGFEGASLDKARWNRVTRENPSLYGLSGGNLVIETGAGELQDSAPNLIMQSVPDGARTYTTKLTVPTTSGGQQGGMVLANPQGNDYLKLAFVNKGNGNKWIEFLRIENGTFDFSGNWHSGPGGSFDGPFLPADFGDTVYLRLSTTDGITYKGEYSRDGQTWQSAGDNRQGFGAEDAVGPYALRGGQDNPTTDASFDSFDVTPDETCGPGNTAPTVEATADKTTGEAPLSVAFSANGTDPDGDALTYSWDFGVAGTDTDTSTEQNPTFTYEQPGTYTATVRTTDAGGATATDTVEVVVEEPAVQTHVIDAVDTGGASRWVPSDLTVQVGDTVRWEFDQALVDHTLTTLGTSSGDAGWNFREYRSPGGAAVEYTFTETGTYDFYCELHSGMNGRITVVEDGGPTNQPPTADATANPTNGGAPLEVAFTGGGTDPDGDALTYSWDFGVEGTEADTADTKDATYTYEQPGTYTATLTVGDGQGGEATDSVQIVVDQPAENQAPTVEASADPSSGEAPLQVSFLADANDPDGRLVTRGPFEVFASGPGLGYTDAVSGTGELTRLPDGTEAMLNVGGLKPNTEYDVHVHAQPCTVNNGGPHYMFDPTKPATSDNEIWLPFTSDAQGNGHAMTDRPLRAGPEAVSIVIHDMAAQGARIACADLSHAEDDLTYEWDFGDGSTTSTEQNPTHTYQEAGTYTATVTATDPDNAEASDAVEITVGEGTPTDTEAPNTSIASGPEGATNSDRATFRFASTEGGSTFECSLDNKAFEPCTSPERYVGLKEGRHTLAVRATDVAGNTDASPARGNWTVDTRGPRVGDLSPRDGSQTRDRTPPMGAKVEDAQTDLTRDDVRLLVDGRRVEEFSYNRSTDQLRYVPNRQMSYSNHRVEVVAEDGAGNQTREVWRFKVVRR